uniref:PRA1 family protein n=1 Tax=Lotharella oceanica TaxID=641309 RepID=A0A7S2U321_9EUKA|mmetsp:Transcript_7868/g.15421  ORF Transcript_7868/g.15421 Transcript_7868/m.15421 type:complete len:183 (+) Transcript_7868:46-594(+)
MSNQSSRRSSLFSSIKSSAPAPSSALQQFIEELSEVLSRLGWSDARPWEEFGRDFKKPTHLEERIWTNFLYFRGNYCYIVAATTILALFFNPTCMLAVMFCVVGMLVFLGVKVETSPGHPMTFEMKFLAGLPVCLLLLMSAGALFWMSYGILLGMCTSLAHMVFRTRTIKSRINKVYEETTK